MAATIQEALASALTPEEHKTFSLPEDTQEETTAIRTEQIIADEIRELESQLAAKRKELKQSTIDVRVSGKIVVVSGLGESVIQLSMARLQHFVKRGGLGLLRDASRGY